MLRSLRRAFLPVLTLGLLTAGCSDPVEPEDASIEDFVGIWTWTVANINSSCGTETGWNAQVTISQVGASETQVSASSDWRADDPGPYSFTGTVSGNTLTIPGVTYTEQSGTLTATHEVVLQNNGTMAGTETWSWVDSTGANTCSGGTADVIASPLGP